MIRTREIPPTLRYWRRYRLPPRRVDIGVVATPDTMFGYPRLEGHRLTLLHLKWLTRKEMADVYELTDTEIDNVIRYWKVRGFEKVR